MKKMGKPYWFGSLLCFLSLILLCWLEWPIKSETREILFQPGELQVVASSSEGPGTFGIPLAFQDAKKITLEWSPIIRKGDRSQIKLSFMGNNGSLIENEKVKTFANSPVYENIYQAYTVNAEARVELSGINEKPEGLYGQVLPQGQDLAFTWEIIPNEEGLYEGIAWLYLRYFPILEGDFIDQAVSAQSFKIKVVSFWGLNSNYWRVIGVLGIIIGCFIQKNQIIRYITRTYKSITNKITKYSQKNIKYKDNLINTCKNFH